MTTIQPADLECDVIAAYGPWRFTRQRVVAGAHVEMFYVLYELAFGPLRLRSAARQVLTFEEFRDQMADPRVDKYLAWDDDGQPIGLTTLTKHLRSVPWISPEYFAARYPEQWARGAVYYLGFTLAHPGMRHQRFLETLIQVGVDSLTAERPVLAYDVCAFNNSALRFTERIERFLDRYPNVSVETIDAQIYYAMIFV